MKLVILHLSDLHIRSSSDSVLARAKAISISLNQYLSDASALFVVFSGDIAFSGVNTQYELATLFLSEIINLVKEEKNLPVSVIMVPGNHDCDFSGGGSVRNAVLEVIRKDGEAAIDEERIATCVQVQESFEQFRKKHEPNPPHRSDSLWTQYLVDVDGTKIMFDCLNVSWCSQLHETQGQLVFPVGKYQHLSVPDHTLRVVILHHPLNWYSQATYHDFRSLVRKAGNFVLSGHEHNQGAGEMHDVYSGQSVYIEGAALQPSSVSENSGFNILNIDLHDQQYKCDLLTWTGSSYVSTQLQEAWSTYRQLPEVRTNEFEMSKEFLEELDNPGANFIHPAYERSLKLSDFYIFPDLEEIIEDGEENRLVSASILQSPESIGNGVLIKGSEKSGKTALLLTLFQRYHDAGYVPVLLRGENISRASEMEIDKLIESAAKQQYMKLDIDKWRNLPRKQKILLYDDLSRTTVADRYRWKVISILANRFTNILITSDEMIDVSEATSPETAKIFSKFNHYQIRPFGHKLRHDLIRKWNCIGDDHTRSSAELIGQVDKAEKVINSVLGKNLVPRVPLYLLTLLQSQESASSGDIQNSAFGYYYQYLLTQDLHRTNVRHNEYGEFFGYCSKLAWFYHEEKKRELDLSTLRNFSELYSKKYHLIDFDSRVIQLCKARWLTKRGDHYSFSYPYIYNFFLGKYLAEHLQSDVEIKNLVERYCEHLYVRDYANAILFLTHHTNDAFVVDCVAKKLRSLFSESNPICLEDDTATLNDLVESTSRLMFSGGEPESNRREQRELVDKAEEKNNDAEKGPQKEIDGELDLASKLNMLFKTVDILGQILKNHYGRIENTDKIVLMREIYRGPLRALRGFLGAIEVDREAIILDIESYISTKAKDLDVDERKKLARRSLFEFIGMVTFGFLHKASTAVGSEHLRHVAKQLIQETPSTSFQLIELGTQLDGPITLPFEDIDRLAKDTAKNVFAHRLLETIVLRHLYFFKTSDTDKQRICSILGVSVANQRQIDTRSKDQKFVQ